MGWLQNKLRDFVEEWEREPQHRQTGVPDGGPTLDYLTAMERRMPQPVGDPSSGVSRMDRTIPDDYFLASCNEPELLFRTMRTDIGSRNPWTVPLGMLHGSCAVTFPDNHVLAIAPPRAQAGKTSSLIVPAILGHANPVVTASTKTDVMTATAMMRAQYGKLWCYAPDGDTEHIPDGVTELRWSPIAGARDWDLAVATAQAMTATLDTRTMRGGDHWKDRAADLLAPVFHWAALSGATMRAARDAVYGHVDELPRIGHALEDYGAHEAAGMLLSIMDGGHEEGRVIASTAARALKGYRTEGALRSTENPNFDIADFVNGGPCSVRADTVYITARSDKQELVAPLIVGFLTQIQRDVYRRHRGLAAAGRDGQAGSAPILFALDELYGLAPLPDLPHMLSEGASQGLLIVAAIQDLSLIKSRWKDEAGAFMTMFGHVLVFPGIRDVATLEAVSKLHGFYDHEKREQSVKRHAAEDVSLFADYTGPWEDREEGARIASERRPVLDPHQVMLGVKPGDPDELILFGPPGVGTVTATPYHRSAPWPMVLTAYFERALSGRVPEWRYWESTLSKVQTDCEDTLPRLPVPRLDTWANAAVNDPRAHPCDRAWAARYLAALREREVALRRGPRPARWELRETVMRAWVVTDRAGRVPEQMPRERAECTSPIETSTSDVTHFPFEEGWGAEDDEDMALRNDSDPYPVAYQKVLAGLEVAILVEKKRRRTRGDTASIERFDSLRTDIAGKVAHDPAFQEQCRQELLASGMRGEDWGWWKWAAPPQVRHIQAFLLGEDAEVEADGDDRAPAAGAARAEEAEETTAPPSPPTTEPGGTAVPPAACWEPDWDPEDNEIISRHLASRASGLPECLTHNLEAMRAAIEAEKERRRQLGDVVSIERFEREWREIYAASDLPDVGERKTREAAESAAEWGVACGFWGCLPPGIPAHTRAFLRGEGVDPPAYGEGPTPAAAGNGRATSAAPGDRQADPIPAVTSARPAPGPKPSHDATPAAAPVPRPARWEPDWGPDEDRTMRQWVGTGHSLPDCFRSNFRQMMTALQREKQRRLQIGDVVSIDLYERQTRRLLADVAEKRPEGQRLEEIIRANSLGFWAFLPPGIEALNKAFLRGEDLELSDGDDPIPPRATNVPKGLTEERWEEIQKETERERAGRVTRSR